MLMNAQDRKVYRMKAQVVQAIAHPIRLAVVDCLADGELCVCHIAERVGAQRSNLSRHLAVMVKAGILESRKEGLWMMYSLRTPCIVKFLGCITTILKDQARDTQTVLACL